MSNYTDNIIFDNSQLVGKIEYNIESLIRRIETLEEEVEKLKKEKDINIHANISSV